MEWCPQVMWGHITDVTHWPERELERDDIQASDIVENPAARDTSPQLAVGLGQAAPMELQLDPQGSEPELEPQVVIIAPPPWRRRRRRQVVGGHLRTTTQAPIPFRTPWALQSGGAKHRPCTMAV
jgi:hypothetical protein